MVSGRASGSSQGWIKVLVEYLLHFFFFISDIFHVAQSSRTGRASWCTD